ncbi:MAG: thioesterase family protein [Desulfovermiculus sp.]
MNVFTTPIDIRFMDIDVMGHVNHTTVIAYFAEGRNTFIADHFSQYSPSGFPFIMAYVACHYLRPIKLENRLLLKIWVKEIGSRSFKLGYDLIDATDNATRYAHGESVQVCYDYDRNSSVELTPELREALREYHGES